MNNDTLKSFVRVPENLASHSFSFLDKPFGWKIYRTASVDLMRRDGMMALCLVAAFSVSFCFFCCHIYSCRGGDWCTCEKEWKGQCCLFLWIIFLIYFIKYFSMSFTFNFASESKMKKTRSSPLTPRVPIRIGMLRPLSTNSTTVGLFCIYIHTTCPKTWHSAARWHKPTSRDGRKTFFRKKNKYQIPGIILFIIMRIL